MATDRFFIAPYDRESGLVKSVKPWLIPDEAYSELNNAYVFRGRVRKRFGSIWLGPTQQSTRLRVNVGTLGGVPVAVPGASGAVGQMFSIADVIFTVNTAGAAVLLVCDGSATTKTFNTASGVYNFSGVLDSNGVAVPAGTIIYWYPALPVMGLVSYENASTNDEQTIAFDTKFAYQYITASGWERLDVEVTPGAATWTGSDSQFFWGASWIGANTFDYDLFVTNYNETEPNFMRVLSNMQWNNYRPVIQVATGSTIGITLDSARILVPFQNYLLAFNTWEREETAVGSGVFVLRHYPFRVRWCTAGAPFPVATSWLQTVPGAGSGLDNQFNQAIITIEFIKDRLIVFCESSTFELVYTGNKVQPFRFQQINNELGAESTFSIVPFDRVAIGVGNVGIHACNGTNVDRIDSSIPDEVWAIHNSESGVDRVYGIRDYFTEMIWWTFPDETARTGYPFPTRVLVYNYKNGTWAFNDDSITAFGYFQPQTGVTWDSQTITWDDAVTWDSGSLQSLFKNVIAGNQQGWTFLIDVDAPTNAPALQITDITIPVPGSNRISIVSINHNLQVGDFIYLQEIAGTGNLSLFNNKIFKIDLEPASANDFTILYTDPTVIIAGVYAGCGIISRVSKINIETKEFNFYLDQGRNVYVSKVDFQVDSTEVGEILVDYFVSTSDNSMVTDSLPVSGTGAILGNGVLETFPYPTVPFEADSSRLIHPCYFQADGEFIQLQLTMNDEQMTRVIVVLDDQGNPTYTGPTFMDFQLHSMTFYATPSSYRNF